MMRERLIYLVSSFWLPLPFLTIREVDRGEEKVELWFLVVLHSLENFMIVLASRLVYLLSCSDLLESYPLGIVVFDCSLVCLNLMAVLVSVFYVKKIELYAGLPTDLPSSLPSFGPEVRFKHSILVPHPISQDVDVVKESQKVKEAEQKVDAALADTVPRRKVILDL